MNIDKTLASLSMDLMRIAMGYRRGSVKMADRFRIEAKERCMELKDAELQVHIQKIIVELLFIMDGEDTVIIAEKSIMYSKLIQNYVTYGTFEESIN